jgi:hypothetical protein
VFLPETAKLHWTLCCAFMPRDNCPSYCTYHRNENSLELLCWVLAAPCAQGNWPPANGMARATGGGDLGELWACTDPVSMWPPFPLISDRNKCDKFDGFFKLTPDELPICGWNCVSINIRIPQICPFLKCILKIWPKVRVWPGPYVSARWSCVEDYTRICLFDK